MNEKKIIYLLMITFFVLGCGQGEDLEFEKDEDLSPLVIDLITTDDSVFFAKTVILFEDSVFLIKTNFDTYINSHPFYKKNYPQGGIRWGYEEIRMQAIEDSYNHDVLVMTDYLKYPGDSIYTLARHLQDGTCLVFDKKRKEIITEIKMKLYMEQDTYGGRRFYIREDFFLETVDWIT